MVLTDYAKELQPKLHQVLQEVRSLVVSGQRFEAATSKRVFKIGLSDYTSALLLPKLISCLQRKAPDIKISVVSIYHLSSTEAFEKGEYDLGIGKIFEISTPVQTQLLYKDTAVCILNPRHELAKKKTITLKDYLAHKHIAIRSENPHFPAVIEEVLATLGYRRDILVSLPFLIPIFNLIEKSDNVIATVLQRMAIHYNTNKNYVIKPVPFKIPDIEFHLAWHQRYNNDLGHQWLRQQIINIFN